MADNGWSLTVTFTGVSDGADSLGADLHSKITASGPNQQIQNRLVVIGGALASVFRDGDPSMMLKLAKTCDNPTAIQFPPPPAQPDE